MDWPSFGVHACTWLTGWVGRIDLWASRSVMFASNDGGDLSEPTLLVDDKKPEDLEEERADAWLDPSEFGLLPRSIEAIVSSTRPTLRITLE